MREHPPVAAVWPQRCGFLPQLNANPDTSYMLRRSVRRLAVAAAAIGALCTTPFSAGAQQGPTPERPAVRAVATPPSQVRLLVAVVMSDQTVRPLPLHLLELVDVADSASRIAVRTGLDGSGAQNLRPGRYRARSAQPVSLNDSTYRWDVSFEVVSGSDTRLELTNANATTTAIARVEAPRTAPRRFAPEREAFEKVRGGVLRVEAGLGHGTAFLIGVAGTAEPLLVTNDHVVSGQSKASVYLDTATRIPALVVARDPEADLAVLRLPPGRCAACPRLPLASPAPGEPLVVAGERVLAIGFPLSQELTLTTGIVSSVRDGVVISDVNVNPGNSGGPMLTVDGRVVAVTTFGDNGRIGPGIAGAVSVTRVTALLARVSGTFASLPVVEDRAMPVIPRTPYPLAALKTAAQFIPPKQYDKLQGRDMGNFVLSVYTPVSQMVAVRAAEDEMAKDRRQREQRAGVAVDEQYSRLAATRDWERYVGDAQTPVVTVAVLPKIGETFWSAFGRSLQVAAAGYSATAASLKFKGDVRGVRFYRNGTEVEPLSGGHGPQAIRIDGAWVSLKDVADMGYYVLPPEAFAPDSTGAPARLTIVVQDLKNPAALSSTDIDGEASARVWDDFRPYYASLGVVQRGTKYGRKSPAVSLWCEPRTGDCHSKRRPNTLPAGRYTDGRYADGFKP
jgi:S1-C subfamily serine protease